MLSKHIKPLDHFIPQPPSSSFPLAMDDTQETLNEEEEKKKKKKENENQQQQQQQQQQQTLEPSDPQRPNEQPLGTKQDPKSNNNNSPPLPPSCTSSPSHDFTFTISLHPPCATSDPDTTASTASTTTTKLNKKTTSAAAFAIDLAPADDIFFHGHLLPLHLLNHPSISPRPSDFSIENLGLAFNPVDASRNQTCHTYNTTINTNGEAKDSFKAKSFASLFKLGKWLHHGGGGGEGEKDSAARKKKKKVFDIIRVFKRYMSSMEPLFFFKGERDRRDLRRRPYSFSGTAKPREKDGWRKKKGEFSAPASMRTSPTNSGLLVAAPTGFSTSDESTMEELQNAIQAAIAHCKNSIAIKEDKSSKC